MEEIMGLATLVANTSNNKITALAAAKSLSPSIAEFYPTGEGSDMTGKNDFVEEKPDVSKYEPHHFGWVVWTEEEKAEW